MNALIEEVKISSAVTPTAGAAGTSAIAGTTLDMQGFDGVLVIVRMGEITSGAATSIKMQQDTDSAMGSAADLEGSSQTIADDDDDQHFYIDLFKPKERYVRLYVSRATQNAVVASATYIQYKSRTHVSSQGSGVSGEELVNPSEGTA